MTGQIYVSQRDLLKVLSGEFANFILFFGVKRFILIWSFVRGEVEGLFLIYLGWVKGRLALEGW